MFVVIAIWLTNIYIPASNRCVVQEWQTSYKCCTQPSPTVLEWLTQARDWEILFGVAVQTRNLSKNLHRRIFRLKFLQRLFHLISTALVGKKHKKWVKMEKFTRWQKFYTAAGSDGMDKFHLCGCVYFCKMKVFRLQEQVRMIRACCLKDL